MISFIINDQACLYNGVKHLCDEYGFSYDNVNKIVKREYKKHRAKKNSTQFVINYGRVNFYIHAYNSNVQSVGYRIDEHGYLASNIIIFDKSYTKQVISEASKQGVTIKVI